MNHLPSARARGARIAWMFVLALAAQAVEPRSAPSDPPAAATADEAQSMALPPEMQLYYLGLIRSGPNRTPQTAADAERLQAAHIANIVRLGKLGKMVVAGPFLDDGDLRGIFVFRVASLAEAESLTATDPTVVAGRLVVEFHPWIVKKGVLPDSLK